METFVTDPVPGCVALATIAVILAFGAVSKLRALRQFELAVAGYRLLPACAVRPFAITFVGAELGSCALLSLPGPRAVGALCAAAVILIATAGIVLNLARGRTDIECGCGALSGASHGGLSWWLVARNAGLVGLAAVAGRTPGAAWSTLTWTDRVTFFGATVALLGLYLVLTQLIESHLRMRRDAA